MNKAEKTDTAGRHLYSFAQDNHMKQMVKASTRKEATLDWILTNTHQNIKDVIVSKQKIGDHQPVAFTLDLGVISLERQRRVLWDFPRAKWKEMKADLQRKSYKEIRGKTVEHTVRNIAKEIHKAMKKHIPFKTSRPVDKTHPWIDAKCEELQGKAHLGDTEAEAELGKRLTQNYKNYAERHKKKMMNAKLPAKKWWQYAKQATHQPVTHGSVPPLMTSKGTWAIQPKEKAQVLADVAQKKNKGIPPWQGEVIWGDEEIQEEWKDKFSIKRRRTKKIFKELKPDTATAEDQIPVIVLRECMLVLIPWITSLVYECWQQGKWPWKIHWLAPIHKKGIPRDPTNYRLVHLTSIISKIVERCLKDYIQGHCESKKVIGDSQWAYRKQWSANDMLAFMLTKWIRVLNQDKKNIGVYLGDIQGAFDKVDKQVLLAKLTKLGLPKHIVRLMKAYFEPRKAQVCVGGEKSDTFTLNNMIFQGTVLGPLMWILFSLDLPEHVSQEIKETCSYLFADDYTAEKVFPPETTQEDILNEMKKIQEKAHQWGKLNRATFEKTKESFVTISYTKPKGEPFRLLGPIIDPKLKMNVAIEAIRNKAMPRLQAIIAAIGELGQKTAILLYKSQVRSVLECFTPAIYHAEKGFLNRLDDVQSKFFAFLKITPEEAFLKHNMAPLAMRRDMAMLGLLFRIARKEAPAPFQTLFIKSGKPTEEEKQNMLWKIIQHKSHRMKRRIGNHELTLDESYMITNNREKNSLWGLVRVFNCIPIGIIERETKVQRFQTKLNDFAKEQANKNRENWQYVFSPRHDTFRKNSLYFK